MIECNALVHSRVAATDRVLACAALTSLRATLVAMVSRQAGASARTAVRSSEPTQSVAPEQFYGAYIGITVGKGERGKERYAHE